MTRQYFCRNVSLVVAILLIVSTLVRYKRTDRDLAAYEEIDFTSEKDTPILSKKEAMKQRTQHLRQVCSQYPKRRQLYAVLKGELFYISEKYNLSYCRVAKVGSTFWTQVFMTLAGVKPEKAFAGEKNSVFNIPRDESHDAMKQHADLTMELKDPRIQTTTSFLVARNPYSRLFSSYIDQIYLPNKWYHASYMIFTYKDEGNRKQCGNDVTFNEFLNAISRYAIQKMPNDLHWAPIFSICSPCDTNIDIIAKQETFNEDTDYILDLAGVDSHIREEVKNALNEDYAEHSLPNLIHTYVTKAHDRKNIKKGCITERQIAERIWTAFQIQGYIHNDLKFPSDKFSSTSSADTILNLSELVLEAVDARPLTSSERQQQRHNWKIHFWKQVSPATLAKVQDAYFEDFFVFQYDMDPNSM